MQQILPPSSVGWRRKKHGVLGFATCVSVCKTLGLGDPIVCPDYWGPQIGERHAETEVEDLGGNWRQWNCSVELVALFQHVQADVAGALLKYTHGCTEMQHKNIQGCWAHNCSSKETQRHKFSTAGLGKNTHITSWIQSLDRPALTVDKLTFASSLRASFVRSVRLPQDRLDELFVQWSFDTFWHCAARSLDMLGPFVRKAGRSVTWLCSTWTTGASIDFWPLALERCQMGSMAWFVGCTRSRGKIASPQWPSIQHFAPDHKSWAPVSSASKCFKQEDLELRFEAVWMFMNISPWIPWRSSYSAWELDEFSMFPFFSDMIA